MKLILGIDACRIRSGGGIAHLVGIIENCDPAQYGICEIHVWSYKKLLDKLPGKDWLVKHNPAQLERSLFHQLWWQFYYMPKEAKKYNCDILFTADASTICSFHPSVVLSQDMLSYEPGQMKNYGMSLKRLRLIAIKYVQSRAMKKSDGVIFLTNYAAKILQQVTGQLKQVAIIPHGIGDDFRQSTSGDDWQDINDKQIRCVYVSNAAMYKHQWVVIKAIGKLRTQGYNINLTLIGGGTGQARKLMDQAISKTDPDNEFIKCEEFVKHDDIPEYLSCADIFVFASSCENLPVTLLEAMASGLPIACSNRGPMPEVLEDGGIYFDPEDCESISLAIELIINDKEKRKNIAERAKELSKQYTWSRCSNETWGFLSHLIQREEKYVKS